ncbi:type VI secretion system protein [Hylemonella sp. W303a]|uniref:type VI secretion system protein n=1 Tax=Hylemonella sp. W303a TaxID=3389873 RepID=UPI00396B301C
MTTLEAFVLKHATAIWIAALSVLALLALWLLLRWRRPRLGKDKKGAGRTPRWPWAGKLRDGVDLLMQALRYLSTRREWRYASPWIMLLGERRAGKSSIAASITDGRREALILREQQLSADGAEWHFCSGGVLIDPDGALSCSDSGSSEDQRWQQLLTAIDARRPERGLDGIVLAVSARTLLKSHGDQLRDVAQLCHRQLWQVQKSFEFVLPVYVVVTQADAIEGYAEFWRNLPPRMRDGLWGWSNPSLIDHEPAAEVARAVCGEVVGGLRELQIALAASGAEIESPDRFFLFPQFFAKLQPGLTAFLETLLKPSVHHANFYFRGVYFCGSEACDGQNLKGVCKAVDFAQPLLQDKVFAEPGLARPLQRSVWSRNRLLRKLQYGLVGAALVLCAALFYDVNSLLRQVDDIKHSVAQIHAKTGNLKQADNCLSYSAISKVLLQMGELNSDGSYLSIPISWFDHRLNTEVGDWLAQKMFEQYVMPSLQCRLEKEASALASAEIFTLDDSLNTTQTVDRMVQQYDDYGRRVGRLEANIAAFSKVAKGGSGTTALERASLLDHLLSELYQVKPEKRTPAERVSYVKSLSAISYSRGPSIDQDYRDKIGQKLQQAGEFLYQEMHERLALGRKLIPRLLSDEPDMDIPGDLALLKDWVRWVDSTWVSDNSDKNPCGRVRETVLGTLDALQAEHGYAGDFAQLRREFDPQQCRTLALAQLAASPVAPYGSLVSQVEGGYQINAALARDERGLTGIEHLPYMKLKPRGVFSCQPALNGWLDPQLKEVDQHLADYAKIRSIIQLDPVKTPLTDLLIRAQLRAVVSERLNEAQRTSLPPQLDASLDARFSDQSTSFDKQREALKRVLAVIPELGSAAFSSAFSECVKNYANDMLRRIDQLTESGKLYEPKPRDVRDMVATDTVFQLGDAHQLTSYLMHQRDRVGVLVGYAAPFMKFLEENFESAGSSSRPGGTGASSSPSLRRWRGTEAELYRYQSGKDLTGSLGSLENFFQSTLATLSYGDCSRALDKASTDSAGTDFFGQWRREIHDTSLLRCKNQSEADALLAYLEIARRFNNELSGRYPFADLRSPDVSLSVVREFFQDYAKRREVLRQKINGLKDSRWRPISAFLDQLDAVTLLLESTGVVSEEPRPLRMKVNFRARRKQELGAEEIIEWGLRAADRKLNDRDPNQVLDFSWGEPVESSLTWATQSVWRPVRRPADVASMSVIGATAKFHEVGDWALLRWLEQHQISSSSDPRGGKRAPVLEFGVPVRDDKGRMGEARLYLELGFNAIDAKGQTAQSLAWPVSWPLFAPRQ